MVYLPWWDRGCAFDLLFTEVRSPACSRFPLFSKGVDTYRFEYGVFLLNKDIEMVAISLSSHALFLTGAHKFLNTQLMSERDLRALDMRHTLPNLKNLLLTVTDPDAISPRQVLLLRRYSFRI